MKYAVGGYFRAQFKIMGVVGILLAAGLLLMRIEYAVLWAALIALLDFLPMLGTGTVLLPWAAFCALSDALPRAAGLLVLYGVTQLTRQLIQPKMVGGQHRRRYADHSLSAVCGIPDLRDPGHDHRGAGRPYCDPVL